MSGDIITACHDSLPPRLTEAPPLGTPTHVVAPFRAKLAERIVTGVGVRRSQSNILSRDTTAMP